MPTENLFGRVRDANTGRKPQVESVRRVKFVPPLTQNLGALLRRAGV